MNQDKEDVAAIIAGMSFKNDLFSPNTFGLNISMLNSLNISPSDARLLEEKTRKLAYEFAFGSISRAVLKKSKEGDIYFRIPKDKNSNYVKDKFEREIESIVGIRNASIITALAANTPYFPAFGNSDIDIYVSEDKNPFGQELTYVVTDIANNANNSNRSTKLFTRVKDNMEHPLYKSLMEKFHNELNYEK